MAWQRLSPYCLQHAVTGARVAKCGYRDAESALAYRYLAYGPDRAAGWRYRAWSSGSAPHWSGTEPPIRFALGEPIPQRYPLLGVYSSAEQAKGCCMTYTGTRTNRPTHQPEQSHGRR